MWQFDLPILGGSFVGEFSFTVFYSGGEGECYLLLRQSSAFMSCRELISMRIPKQPVSAAS
jgi:hypothetical protein